MLHEIGLFCVTPKLQKSFVQKKLTTSEIILLKQVPKMGYLLLMTVDILQPIANIILHHQEYLNGSGYPHELKNDAIPFTAKILLEIYVKNNQVQDYSNPFSHKDLDLKDLRLLLGDNMGINNL